MGTRLPECHVFLRNPTVISWHSKENWVPEFRQRQPDVTMGMIVSIYTTA